MPSHSLLLPRPLICVLFLNPWYINVFQIRWFTRGGGGFWPPCRFFICGRILMIFFLSTPHHVYSPKHISFFFYDHYDVRYGHFSTSGVSKNHVFSSFWLTAFLLDFCPTLFWSKIDAWDNSYWNYISTCLGKIYKFVKKRHLWRHMTSSN